MPGSEVAKCLDGDLTFRGCGGGRALEGTGESVGQSGS